MTYGLNYVTPSDLFNYGFKLTKNDNYIYRVIGHSGFKSKIYVYFQIDLDENMITYEVKKEDGSIYYPYYNCYFANKVRDNIDKAIDSEMKKMKKKGILK